MNHLFQETFIYGNKTPILYENTIQPSLRYASLEIDEEYISQEQKKKQHLRNIKAIIICMIGIIIFIFIIILFINYMINEDYA